MVPKPYLLAGVRCKGALSHPQRLAYKVPSPMAADLRHHGRAGSGPGADQTLPCQDQLASEHKANMSLSALGLSIASVASICDIGFN